VKSSFTGSQSDDAAERRTDLGLDELRLDQLQLGAQDVELPKCYVVALTRNDTVLEELHLPGLGALREFDPIQRSLAVGEELGIVDFQEELALGNPTPLFELNRGDLARDLVASRSVSSAGATRWVLTRRVFLDGAAAAGAEDRRSSNSFGAANKATTASATNIPTPRRGIALMVSPVFRFSKSPTRRIFITRERARPGDFTNHGRHPPRDAVDSLSQQEIENITF
jgi:hypothetical protein